MERACKAVASMEIAFTQGLRRLSRQARKLFKSLAERRAAYRNAAMLEKFGDSGLKDIGLSRGDLISIETGGFFSDGSRRQRG